MLHFRAMPPQDQPDRPAAPIAAAPRFPGLRAAVLVALVVAFAGVGGRSLWSPDEPTGAAVGRAMADSGEYFLTRLNGQPFLEKPPLYWWVQTVPLRLFGYSAWAARLPSALFGALTLLVAFALGRRLGGPRLGWLALAVLASTVLFVEDIGRVVVDPALMFFVALAHAGFVLLAEPRRPAEERGGPFLIALALSLAFLSKGVVALALGAGPPVLYLLATRRGRAIRRLAPVVAVGIAAFALIVLPWALGLYRAGGWPAVAECLLNNTSGRFLRNQAGTVYGHRQPLLYYLTTAPAVLLPWTLAVPALLRRAWLRRRERGAGEESLRLLLATVGIGIAILSLAASKRDLYLLPLLPAFAVTVAAWLDGSRDAERPRGSWDRPTLLVLLGFAALLPLLLWGAAFAVHGRLGDRPELAPVRAEISGPGLAGAGLLALAATALLAARALRSGRRGPWPGAAWIVTPFLLLFLLLQTAGKALVDPVKNLDDLTAAIHRFIPGPGPVPAYLAPRSSPESFFGIVGFNLGRTTLRFTDPQEALSYLAQKPGARAVFRMEEVRKLPPGLTSSLRFVYDESGRKASPYGIAELARPVGPDAPR